MHFILFAFIIFRGRYTGILNSYWHGNSFRITQLHITANQTKSFLLLQKLHKLFIRDALNLNVNRDEITTIPFTFLVFRLKSKVFPPFRYCCLPFYLVFVFQFTAYIYSYLLTYQYFFASRKYFVIQVLFMATGSSRENEQLLHLVHGPVTKLHVYTFFFF